MNNLRFILVIALLPFVLAACQSTQSVSSSFASLNGINAPVSKPVNPNSGALIPGNELASSAKPVTSEEPKAEADLTDQLKPAEEVAAKPKKRKRGPKAKMAARKSKYKRIIAKHARANGVPLNLALAVVQVESAYRVNARGAAGEVGLMQLLPRTARYIGYKGKMKHLYNPDTNIRYGMKYLGKAHKLGGGSTCGTILKYNAGHGAKKMNRISRRYCKRVRRIMRNG